MDSKTLALLATLVLAATMTMNTTSSQDSWESYKSAHGKLYSAEEDSYRQAVFMAAQVEVETHNADSTQTYTIEINKFSDLTQEEFAGIYLGFKTDSEIVEAVDDVEMIGDVNWVTKGAVQKVKDQGQCGSCWAFSSVASTESAKFLTVGTLGDFSEQQLVDCTFITGGNLGCNGGQMDNSFKYYAKEGKICTESSYPYKAKLGSCQKNSCTGDSFTISGHTDVGKSTSALKTACNSRPVSIAVDASKWSPYKSGIFSNCGTSLDHGVLLAGYTSSYWLVKNSWAATWGEQGYIRLAPGNTCGLANQASYPTH